MTEGVAPGRTGSDAVTAELFVHGLLPVGAEATQATLVDRARRLEAEGTLDELAVYDRERTSGRTDAAFLLERLDAFESWARREDMAVGSFFARDAVRSAVTGDRREAPVFPPVALAEWRGEDLAFVAPCTDGRTVYTVPDRLDVLAGDAGAPRARSTDG